jgi:hypothetical protein
MKKIFFSIALIGVFTVSLQAQQIGISAEVRPRFENKHGYKTLLNTNEEGSNFISQRTRLNFFFNQDNLKLGVSFQNVRVWGDVSTLSANDKANSLHEAWAEYAISDQFSLKFGRQEIVYDDSRIFGNVGWAQQARSHDALIAKIILKDKSRLDLGFALNNDNQSEKDLLYSNAAGYKTFQYAWYHTKIKNVGLSFLALNVGVEYLDFLNEQKINNTQTVGGRATFKVANIMFDGATYIQNALFDNTDVDAYYLGGNAKIKASENYTLGLGFEYLSGKDMNDVTPGVKSFNPVFGTNHKFNGWMDYFYVGNHLGNVGLVDFYATIAYKKDKFSAKLVPHIFKSAADIYDGTSNVSRNLGTEIDFTIGYKISKNINFSAGHSNMFASSSMELLKGGSSTENNSWTWLMFTFKPTLFTSTK